LYAEPEVYMTHSLMRMKDNK